MICVWASFLTYRKPYCLEVELNLKFGKCRVDKQICYFLNQNDVEICFYWKKLNKREILFCCVFVATFPFNGVNCGYVVFTLLSGNKILFDVTFECQVSA